MTITVRPFEPSDRELLLQTLDAARAPANPDLDGDFAAFGDWLRASPGGSRTFVGIEQGEIVAQLTAVPRITRIGADERRFAELIGGWSAPRRRRGLRRRPDFALVADALFAAHQGVEGDFVYHTCPTPAERRLGCALLEWKPVTTLPLLHFDLRGAPSRPASPAVAPIHDFDASFGELFERCTGELPAATRRDATFLKHRFGDHPGGGFVVLGEREDAGLRGYAVLRCSRFAAEQHVMWMHDWLVPSSEATTGEHLVQSCLTHAREQGCTALATFLPEWSPWFLRLQDLGFRVRPSNRFLFSRTSARRYDSHWLHQNWWHTLADTVIEPQLATPGGAP